MSDTITVLRRARDLVAKGDDEAAKQVYLEGLKADPEDCDTLLELGALAHASGHISAARGAYQQAVRCHPRSKMAQVGYACLLEEAGDPVAAKGHYLAALALDAEYPRAHQGLARLLTNLGEDAAIHWRKGFGGHAVVHRRFRGTEAGIPLLLLVAAVGGNIPTQHWIDDKVYAVTAIYADFFDPTDCLPPHAVVVNAIGDADLCGRALANARHVVDQSKAPVINAPAMVQRTGREANARRLTGIPGVVTPCVTRLSRASNQRFPLLLRAPGYHTGEHFVRVDVVDDLYQAAASIPCEDPLAIEYLDTRGDDGMTRKYRVMFIGGNMYPLHMAISADWKVHYFTSAMAANPAFRKEEQCFLNDMPAVLGEQAMRALSVIQLALGLDYAGIDFSLGKDGSVVLFEANATMAMVPIDSSPMWDYRRRAAGNALAAAQRLLPRQPQPVQLRPRQMLSQQLLVRSAEQA